MRPLAISLMMLAGAVMASAGAIAEAMPASKRWSAVDEWGLSVVALSAILMIVELWPMPVTDEASRPKDLG